ncbi:MAG: helicase-related protein [Halobacteria archaeon]
MGDRCIETMIKPGDILEGDLFNEPMRVETTQTDGNGVWALGLVGVRSETFRRVRLTEKELSRLTVRSAIPTYKGDGSLLRLGLQAHALGIAYEFDPYFGLSISRVDPLPHQLEAVYDYLLKLPVVKFLLADDAGAGKTIMAGLLLRELKLRGLVEKTLIVCPANLTFQWQRELKEKFDEKFLVIKGAELRTQFGINPWREHPQVITSLDLAKKEDVLPGLRQSQWDLVIIDEAHRMSASSEERKSLRYRLGELLRDTTHNILLLTATPHRGDPQNFTLFLRLLDQDAYADVKSIQEAMARRRAPFYLRRLKEAMVYFPQRQPDGTWQTEKIFTKRIPSTVRFSIDGDEFALYDAVTKFVKDQSALAAAREATDPRARALGFLMALFQRRLASSTFALKSSLEKRANLLEKRLQLAEDVAKNGPFEIPGEEELEEMEEEERERLEEKAQAVTLARNKEEVLEEVSALRELAKQAQKVIDAEVEAKLNKLKELLREQGFFDNPDKRLLIFTEFKDTLKYLVERLQEWNFRVGFIHGSMKPGSRDEEGTRIWTEQQFWDGKIQILVATEAAGEGINLHCCNLMFNYDIPWNPNRLEQRMGRIHRYGQKEPCLIFNFVAVNTIEGHVLETLLEKLQGIRDALKDDAVFNVVGEAIPPAHIERILRDYYAGKIGKADLEERVLRNVSEDRFRNICQNALEGLATRSLNLAMLVERKARAQERRLVPETVSRFIVETGGVAGMSLKPVGAYRHTFDPGATPPALRRYETDSTWRLPPLANRYPRFTTDRKTAEEKKFEWVTPGHPLFEALRRHAVETARPMFGQGACVHSLAHTRPARIDFYRAQVADGLDRVIHEHLFAVELDEVADPVLREPGILGDMLPAPAPASLPPVATLPEPMAFLHDSALQPFLEKVKKERLEELDRVARHVDIALTELIAREDEKIGRFEEEKKRGVPMADQNLAKALDAHAKLLARRDRRREELKRQRGLKLQNIERLTSVLVLPHPERDRPEIRNLRPDAEVERIAMETAIEHETAQGRIVQDVHEKNLGYDITSLDSRNGDLRLIEVKGLSASDGTIVLTPNERRVAEDRRDCYWLYVVTDCGTEKPRVNAFRDPAACPWQPVQRIQHYTLSLSTLRQNGEKSVLK